MRIFDIFMRRRSGRKRCADHCGERACPALGRVAALKPNAACCLTACGVFIGTAAQPSAGQARSPQVGQTLVLRSTPNAAAKAFTIGLRGALWRRMRLKAVLR